MKLDANKFMPVLIEIGHIMYENHTDNVEIEVSTPGGTVIFEVTMNLKEEDDDE